MIRSNPFGPVTLSGRDAAELKAALERPVSQAAIQLLARAARLAPFLRAAESPAKSDRSDER